METHVFYICSLMKENLSFRFYDKNKDWSLIYGSIGIEDFDVLIHKEIYTEKYTEELWYSYNSICCFDKRLKFVIEEDDKFKDLISEEINFYHPWEGYETMRLWDVCSIDLEESRIIYLMKFFELNPKDLDLH